MTERVRKNKRKRCLNTNYDWIRALLVDCESKIQTIDTGKKDESLEKQIKGVSNRLVETIEKMYASDFPSAVIREINVKNRTKRKKVKLHFTRKESVQKGLSRWGDQYYYFVRFIQSQREQNPIPTEEDMAAKREIFGIPDLQTCILTHKRSNGTGDHLFAINGYARSTEKCYGEKRHGWYDWWNTVPVIGSHNTSYKLYWVPVMNDSGTPKFKKVDIGWQTLTDSEYAVQPPERQRVYDMICAWRRYVEKRGAKLFMVFTEEESAFLAQKKREYSNMWDM